MKIKKISFKSQLIALVLLISGNLIGIQSCINEYQKKADTRDLYYAVKNNNIDEARSLLKSGRADPNSIEAEMGGYQYETMLQKAVENDSEILVRLLLASGANPNLKSPYGSSFPLDDAARLQNEKLLHILLQAGASPNAWRSKQPQIYEHGIQSNIASITTTARPTIVTAAERKDNTRILQALLNAGADINAREPNFDKHNALMVAARMGNISNVKFLLDHNADANLTDANGMTALDLAKKERHQEIVEMLKKITKNGN